ncbi:DUF1223 domain-containing protein [Rhizobium sp. PAMB 3174]
MNMKTIMTALTALLLSGGLANADGTPKGVVELFTSQGCSSCPPADAALGKLIQQGDIVGLSYHVDYWNSLGWPDTMSAPAFTARQYGYAKTLGRSGVYTPQAVLNGRDHIIGSDVAGINARLTKQQADGEGMTVPVRAAMNGNELDIEIGKGTGKADVVVVYFNDKRTVDIKAGENNGRTVTYWHSVTDVQTVGMWNGSDLKISLPKSVFKNVKGNGCAVLLQEYAEDGTPKAIRGATTVMAKN